MHVEDNLRSGMTAAEAWRDATLKFGVIDQTKESMREGATMMILETTLHDLPYAMRGLLGNPGFATTAILSLALGIGASVAIFTLAGHPAMSPRTFARQFRQQTGTTPHQWLAHQRLLPAQTRLEKTDDGIDAIAEAVGLQTAATLRQHFSRTLDTTPTAFRRRFSTT